MELVIIGLARLVLGKVSGNGKPFARARRKHCQIIQMVIFMESTTNFEVQ
jgi:hypothetical protein